MVADYPLGAGGYGFEELSPIYIPAVVAAHGGDKRAPHNTLVLTAAEWGVPGLVLLLGYYGSALLLMRRVRKRATSILWVYRALSVELAFVGVFVAGFFTDRLYAEAPFWMGGMAVALHRIQSWQLAEATAQAPAPTAPASVTNYELNLSGLRQRSGPAGSA